MTDRLNAMDVDADRLRVWAAAERMAVIAEEMIRNPSAAPPSEDLKRLALERRKEADQLFRALLEAAKQTPRGVSGS